MFQDDADLIIILGIVENEQSTIVSQYFAENMKHALEIKLLSPEHHHSDAFLAPISLSHFPHHGFWGSSKETSEQSLGDDDAELGIDRTPFSIFANRRVDNLIESGLMLPR